MIPIQLIARLSRELPFSYLWIFDKVIGDEINTVLDLGCGEGQTMKDISKDRNWQITGIDLHKESVVLARKSGIYKKVILGDVIKETKKLIKQKRSYDMVFLSQVIEHIDKDEGYLLIKMMEKLSKKKVVITTPKGYVDQHEQFIEENPFHDHKSGWNVMDFKKSGYGVYGMGFGGIWSGNKLIKMKSEFLVILFSLLSYLLAPMCFYFPNISAGLIAVKRK